MPRRIILAIAYIFLFSNIASASADAPLRWSFEDPELKLRLIARSQDQMAAFYEARGFPQRAIKTLSQFCFFTVGIANKSDEILLLDLGKWSFESKDKKFKRYHRDVLKKHWLETGIEKRLISTFRWTLLPEKLDFHPDEHEGGNIVVSRSQAPFSIEATFTKGTTNNSGIIKMNLKDVRCAGSK